MPSVQVVNTFWIDMAAATRNLLVLTGPDAGPKAAIVRHNRRVEHPHAAEMEAERLGWYELVELVRQLTPEECVEPGYYRNPDWTVRDVVAHLGTWLAEAQLQFERISAGTYEGHDVDVDALNALLLEAMQGQPWEVAWLQANAGRTRMIDEWYRLGEPNDEAAWWIRKSGSEHYAEHLPRLREWVAEVVARRVVVF